MDSKIKTLTEQYLSKKVVSGNRIGGYSAENYLVKTETNRRFIVKILRNDSDNYFDKLEKTTNRLKEHKTIPYKAPKVAEKQDKIAIFPYVKGTVLHGNAIKKQVFKPVAILLSEFENTKAIDDTQHSVDLYLNLDKGKKQIESVLKKVKSKKNYIHSKTLTDILDLKKSILKKYEKESALLNWLKKSDNFVHGDFHSRSKTLYTTRLFSAPSKYRRLINQNFRVLCQ